MVLELTGRMFAHELAIKALVLACPDREKLRSAWRQLLESEAERLLQTPGYTQSEHLREALNSELGRFTEWVEHDWGAHGF